jgi:hypothetical protein
MQFRGLVSDFTPRQARKNQRKILGGKLRCLSPNLPVDNIHRRRIDQQSLSASPTF